MKEFDLLEHIYLANASLPAGVSIGPGDDMGAIRLGDQTLLVTVDQVADGVHVDAAAAPVAKIGRKAMTRSLSDVAAMAARPVAAVAAASLPRDFGAARAKELCDALRRTSESYDCPLIGGDLSFWDQSLLISVTVFAEPAGIDPVTRCGAKVGDIVCVSGALGGSLETIGGHTHHLDFEPRIALARKLGGDAATRPHCMIDLSDGLGRDLGHLCAAAGVHAELDAEALPISPGAVAAAQRDGVPAWRHALADGEDYELCFTIDAGRAQSALPDQIDGIAIARIGRIVAAQGRAAVVSVKLPDGTLAQVGDLGWEHRG
jgi:thiamine-monophosphate kinase